MSPFCGECRQECETSVEDVGIGEHEFWGAKGNDVRHVLLSACCDADVFDDEELRVNAEIPPDPHEPDPDDERDRLRECQEDLDFERQIEARQRYEDSFKEETLMN